MEAVNSALNEISNILDEAGIYKPANEPSGAEVRESADPRYKVAEDLCWYPNNDYGNARRLQHHSGGNLLYVRDNGWFAYDGKRWDGEHGEFIARSMAQQSVVAMRDEVAFLKSRDGLGMQGVADMLDAKRAWVKQSGNSNKITAMLREMEPMCCVDVNEFDQDKMMLNVQNGTLVFDPAMVEVKLRPHSRDDKITNCCDVVYNKNAKAVLFKKFLKEIIPSREKRSFIQRWLGYSMLGLTTEQVLVLFQGQGANGKSVLVDAVHELMGDYAQTLPFESLLHDDRRRGGEASPDMAMLVGKRFVVASEPETGARFSESRVKSLTGGEEIIARHLNKGFFTFKPHAKFTLTFNNKPLVRGMDNGIWRRLLLVEFNQIIPPDERDKLLSIKLAQEKAGILNWLIEGALDWMAEGLQVPEIVSKATDTYKMESNPVASFAESCLAEAAPNHNLSAKLVRKVYEGWCRDNGVDPMNANAFGRAMTGRGIKRDKVGGVMNYIGLCLTDYGDQFNGDGTATAEAFAENAKNGPNHPESSCNNVV